MKMLVQAESEKLVVDLPRLYRVLAIRVHWYIVFKSCWSSANQPCFNQKNNCCCCFPSLWINTGLKNKRKSPKKHARRVLERLSKHIWRAGQRHQCHTTSSSLSIDNIHNSNYLLTVTMRKRNSSSFGKCIHWLRLVKLKRMDPQIRASVKTMKRLIICLKLNFTELADWLPNRQALH